MQPTLTSPDEPARTMATKDTATSLSSAVTVRTYDAGLEQRVLRRIDELRTYQDDWDGEGTAAPRPEVLDAMACCVRRRFSEFTPEPYVTPMAGGNVQFEWHRGNRTLELEFEGPETVHYLQWDSEVNVNEEGTFPFYDNHKLEELLRWFVAKSLG